MKKIWFFLLGFCAFLSCGGGSESSSAGETGHLHAGGASEENMAAQACVTSISALNKGMQTGDFGDYANSVCDSLKAQAFKMQAFYGFIPDSAKQSFNEMEPLFDAKYFHAAVDGETAFVTMNAEGMEKRDELGIDKESSVDSVVVIKVNGQWKVCD